MSFVNRYDGVLTLDILVNELDLDEGCVLDLSEKVRLWVLCVAAMFLVVGLVGMLEVTHFFRQPGQRVIHWSL